MIGMNGCDIITPPYKKNSVVTPPDTSKVFKKAVLEEFTGHNCQNCPDKGHIPAKQLKALYGDRFIAIAYHVSSFAEPSKRYPPDYRTPTGNEIFYIAREPGLPSGIVNRLEVNGQMAQSSDSWGTVVQQELATEAEVKLELTPQFNEQTKLATFTVKITLLEDAQEPLYLALYMLEDSIVSPQNVMGVRDTMYVHKDMFRGAINSTYGDQVFDMGKKKGEVVTKTYTFAMDKVTWRPEHCSAVAIVHVNAPAYEILQAEEVKLK